MTAMPLSADATSSSNPLAGALAAALSPFKAYQTNDENKKLAAWAKEQFNAARTDRTRTERQWLINLAFYSGQHYVQWIKAANTALGGGLQVPKAPPWRVRLTVNKVRVMARHEMSTLTSTKPMFDVLPASTEDQDFMAARVALNIFEATYRDLKIQRELRKAIFWSVITGVGYLKDWWDSSKTAADGVSQGDICVERLNPFDVYVPNIREEDIEKQPWVCHAHTKPANEVKSKFGVDVAPNAKATENPLYDAFLAMAGVRTDLKDQVLLLEFWIKPGGHELFPNGGMFTVAGDQVVQRIDQYPYQTGEFPFTKIDGVPSGRFYGTSFIEDIIPLQREYNRTVSQIIEAKNLTSKPKLLAQKGSINPASITSEPGQTILYEAGYNEPHPINLAPLPNYVFDSLNRVSMDMDDISSQHDITRGEAPGQVTAATAISYLQEQDSSKLIYQVQSVEEALEKLGRHILKHVSQYWDQPRRVRVLGTDNAFEAALWSQDDLKGNTDIRVQAGSAMPRSKAAQQAMIMDLLKMGLLPDPAVGLELIGIGGIDKIMADFLVDKRQAQRENMRMANTEPPAMQPTVPPVANPYNPNDVAGGQPADTPMAPMLPVNTWDNHQIHIKLHNDFRKTEQFEMLDPMIKQMFEQHVNAHQAAMMGGVVHVTPDGTPVNTPQQGPPAGPDGGPPPPDGSGGDPNAGPPQQGGPPQGPPDQQQLPPEALNGQP